MIDFTAFLLTAATFYILGCCAGHNKENFKDE